MFSPEDLNILHRGAQHIPDPNLLYPLFSREFIQLVGISFLIAAPAGWLIMHRWLENYTYRISLTWWIFILAGLTGILVTMFTISVQAVRTALANPVDNLRTE